MIGAVVRNNTVETLIVINEEQIEHFSSTLKCTIVNASPYGLAIGDFCMNGKWTRNINGEQKVLPLLDEQVQDSYSIMAEKAAELESAQDSIVDEVVNETLSILQEG